MAKIETCRRCVYAYWDGSLWMRTLFSGFPCGPMCANRPGTLGVMREVRGGICRNYREKPAEPDAQARRITLTNGMVAYVDAADYEELSRYTWHYASGGYAARYENRTLILMHRQIMNPPEGMQVDHIHHNRLDNTRAHLWVCTASENARNRSKRGCASSRYFGVTYNKRRKKWVASIKVEGRVRQVGFSQDEREAARAHDYAAVRYFGDHVRLNFPDEWPAERRAEVRAMRQADSGKQPNAKRKAPAARRTTKMPQRPRPRATGHEPQTTKKQSRAETRGRRVAKRTSETRKTPRRKRG